MRVAVTGADGQLGRDLVTVLGRDHDTVAITHTELEITDPASVRGSIGDLRPDCVVNSAAFHHLDRCEAEPAQAFAVNAIGAGYLAEACREASASLVHISTDYVFDGAKGAPYKEDDPTAPLNTYGVSKLAGEHMIRKALSRHTIVRTASLYGEHPCRAKGGDNFVRLMLRLARERDEIRVVDDQICSPTFTIDLAQQIAVLIEGAHYGTFHAAGEGSCSWYAFALAIFELAGADPRVIPVYGPDGGSPIRRPANSALDNHALRELGLMRIRPWREALAAYLA